VPTSGVYQVNAYVLYTGIGSVNMVYNDTDIPGMTSDASDGSGSLSRSMLMNLTVGSTLKIVVKNGSDGNTITISEDSIFSVAQVQASVPT
jgi:hypothetical protein